MDITITLTLPQAFQVQEAIDARLARLERSEKRVGTFGGDVDGVARRNLEAAKGTLIEALYATEQEAVAS